MMTTTLKIKDINLATSLVSLGYDYTLERKDSKICVFIFDKSPELNVAIDDFWNKRLLIEPQLLLNTHKMLKIRVNEAIYGVN